MTIGSGVILVAAPVSPRRRRGSLTALLAVLTFALVLGTAACSDDDDDNSDNVAKCGTVALPLSDDPNGPILTDVALQCQGDVLGVLVTVTDAQGSADLEDVEQRVVVLGQPDCEGTVEFEVMGIVSGSGVEANFGQVINRTTQEALFDEICSAEEWPVEIHLFDDSANHTFGRVMARLTF